jgi:hypothetical protein
MNGSINDGLMSAGISHRQICWDHGTGWTRTVGMSSRLLLGSNRDQWTQPPQEGKTEIKTLSRCLGGVACLLGAAAFMGSVRTSNQAQSRLQHKTDPESCEDQSQGDQSESGYLSQYHGKGHGCELFLLACWGCRHTGISQGKKAGISRGM